MVLEHALVSALRDRATRELVPSVLLSNGRGGLPASTAEDAIPRRPAVLLDRDGVINANRADYVKSWDEFELLPGALEALASLAELSLPVVVVTNQSGVNRQIIDFEVAESINRRLMDLVTAHGGRIDAVAWCPHRPDEACGCRKPQPGLLTYAADSLHIDLPRSYLIGDAVTDMEAGLAVGCKTALTLTGRGASHRFQVAARLGEACQVVDDLAAAVDWVARDLAARRQVPEPEKQ
jgi:D-glycero-D-manno-heptose 1,7-bisphosphate phosphatase